MGYAELLYEGCNEAPEFTPLRLSLRDLQSAGEEMITFLGFTLGAVGKSIPNKSN